EGGMHVFQHAMLTDEDALAADLEGRILREQLGQRRPLTLVDEVTVRALQSLDLIHVLEARDTRLERIQPIGDRLRVSRHCGEQRSDEDGAGRGAVTISA